MAVDGDILRLPPLQGCLYCHTEGTTALFPGRRILGIGSDFPILKCSRCGTTADFDADPALPDAWHIRFRHCNHDPRYFYVAQHFAGAGWLTAQQALTISTDGFIQRQRVQQAQSGDLSWLQPEQMPVAEREGQPYLSLKGVTLQETNSSSFFGFGGSSAVLDSGKLFVTAEYLYLDGQRQVWKYPFDMLGGIRYTDQAWIVAIEHGDQPLTMQGVNLSDQFDVQLIAAVIEALWRKSLANTRFE
ncbi:MAG TPA: hypothetical protein PKD09_00820 [Aggregatilinea sp.]|uniref:hypothetical protein n=1 Tax=Aggregatilinea sp. TaxID=2806333 RepID=UPI002C1C6D9F|nr:hypothetical protein [Aggregatilinea sp.]HML20156.1 hypothetical protein [Aggregatilinea sp.]